MKVYPVLPKTKADLEATALNVLAEFDPEHLREPKPLNVVRLIDNFLMQKYDWSLDVREDLPSDILGLSNPQTKTIVVSEQTYNSVQMGDGRSRFTCCHEFSHVELHRTQMRFRMVTMNANDDSLMRTDRTNLRAFEDPEWQADYLAGALLMPRPIVLKMMQQFRTFEELINEMTERFQVSRSAAEMRVQKMPK